MRTNHRELLGGGVLLLCVALAGCSKPKPTETAVPETPAPTPAKSGVMRTSYLFISLIAFASLMQAGDFKLYATFNEDTKVELSDGVVWMMDKGDVFPVEAYKNMQKNIILRLEMADVRPPGRPSATNSP